MKILMVCLGNICRSPLAQGVLEKKILDKKLDWQVDSAGTSSFHIGSKPDPRSIQTAKKFAIDISKQRARQFREEDFNAFDLILAMDKSNYRDLLQIAPDEARAKKVKMILEYVYPNERRPVPDPYWDDNGFEEVYNMLNEACENLIRHETLKTA